MPRSNKKRFKTGGIPVPEKQFLGDVQTRLYDMTPSWSFVKCDLDHDKWGIQTNTGYLAGMLARFKEWERLTWEDILTATSGRKHHTQSHLIPIESLDGEAKKRLKILRLDSYDVLYSLAITGKQRAWGIMIEETGTFQLLWYDPKHEVYPVSKD